MDMCRHPPGGETLLWSQIQGVLNSLAALDMEGQGVVSARPCSLPPTSELILSSQVGAMSSPPEAGLLWFKCPDLNV